MYSGICPNSECPSDISDLRADFFSTFEINLLGHVHYLLLLLVIIELSREGWMGTKFKRAAFFLIGCLASPTLAAPGWGVNALTIESFISSPDGLTLVVANNDNPMSCSVASWLKLPLSTSNFEATSAALLTAFAQRTTVKVWQDSCHSSGWVQFTAAWVDK
jgi:hypothetical protein